MSDIVDSSVVLAVLNGEANWRSFEVFLAGSRISSVNFAEVAAKLAAGGANAAYVERIRRRLSLQVVPFTEAHAIEAGMLRPVTKGRGLSLGDRACLAFARIDGGVVLTTDRLWAEVAVGVEVRLMR